MLMKDVIEGGGLLYTHFEDSPEPKLALIHHLATAALLRL